MHAHSFPSGLAGCMDGDNIIFDKKQLEIYVIFHLQGVCIFVLHVLRNKYVSASLSVSSCTLINRLSGSYVCTILRLVLKQVNFTLHTNVPIKVSSNIKKTVWKLFSRKDYVQSTQGTGSTVSPKIINFQLLQLINFNFVILHRLCLLKHVPSLSIASSPQVARQSLHNCILVTS